MRETCRLENRKYTFLFPIVLPEYSYYAQVEVLTETETNDEGWRSYVWKPSTLFSPNALLKLDSYDDDDDDGFWVK